MNEHHQKQAPGFLRFLYGLGLAFIIVGLIDLFGHGNLIPEKLHFLNYEITLIIIGIALLIPSALFAIKPEEKYEIPHRTRHRRH